MVTAIRAKAAKQISIVRREEQADGITYYVLSGENLYTVKLVDDKATCNCESYQFSARSNKHCKHTDLAQQNEQERSTDLQQHVRDDIHSCILCGRRMSADGWCGC